MAWENRGAIALENGSKTVSATGVSWASPNVMPGYILYIEGQKLYEIGELNGAGELTLKENYAGPTAQGVSYMIVPTKGADDELHRLLNEFLERDRALADQHSSLMTNLENAYNSWLADRQAEFDQVAAHKGRTDNPHGVTAAQVGAPTVAQMDAAVAPHVAHTGRTDNPHAVTAAQVGALPLAGGTITGPIIKSGSGIWAEFQSTVDAHSYATFRKPSGNTLGIIGNDGGGAVSGGSGDNLCLRAENELLFAAGGNGVKARLSAAGHLTLPNVPAFHAIGAASLAGNGPLICNNVALNNGNHYNPATGVFTAPVTGRYYFSAGLLVRTSAGASSYAVLTFRRNGGNYLPYFHSMAGVSRPYEPLFGGLPIQLNQGDTVYAHIGVGGGGEIYDGSYTGLSGYLIG